MSEQELVPHEHVRRRMDYAYIPALRLNLLTPIYDLMMKYAVRESVFKSKLIEQARLKENHMVLDVGCGTGTLTVLMKKLQPRASIFGIDTDPEVLAIAQDKANKSYVDVHFDVGTALELPYPEGSFNRVFVSMALHHFDGDGKVVALREAFRVLKSAGELHVADLGKPHNFVMRLPSLIIGRFEEASDNVKGLLPAMMRKAGFVHVQETSRFMTLVGTVSLFKASKAPKTRRIDVTGFGRQLLEVKR